MALVAVALMEAVLTAAVATVEAVEAAVVEVVVKGLGVVAMEVVVEVGPEVVGKMEEVEMVEDLRGPGSEHKHGYGQPGSTI